MSIDAARTVRELAIEIPDATRTFEKLGIDYCCGGSRSLNDACRTCSRPGGRRAKRARTEQSL